jgi:hypothetical protein
MGFAMGWDGMRWDDVDGISAVIVTSILGYPWCGRKVEDGRGGYFTASRGEKEMELLMARCLTLLTPSNKFSL